MNSSFPNPESSSDPSSRKKRRKIDTGARSGGQATAESSGARWRTDTAQQIYSSKLVEALRHVRRNSAASPPAAGGRLVRETADRVLAAAARGRSRWSRAILARRLIRSPRKHKKAKVAAGAPRGMTRSPPVLPRRLPAVEKKVRVLGRLVPGCRKLPFPNLLDEASDYIAALEMQVRAMTALTELLAGATATRLASGASSPS